MSRKTHLASTLSVAQMKAQYDSEAKKIVADKRILSRIIKEAVEEMKDYDLEEIAEAIEKVEISEVPIYPGRKPQAITGMSTEDKVPNEGEVTFDIRFYVITPKGERIKLIINVEIQKDYYPGYDLVTRGIFYCARMLSAQLDTEFSADDYDNIKKVYSIWLCLNAPKDIEGSLVKYSIKPEIITTKVGKENKLLNHRYDLLSVVMIGLNKDSFRQPRTELHGMLGTVFSEELKPEEKLEILSKEYQMETTEETKEGVNVMCNLSDAIEERGLRRGEERGEQKKLIEQVCRKVQKNKALSVIAEELEEEEALIKPIYEAVLQSAPNYDCNKLYSILNGE